jgi:hypothetical protein
MVVVDENKRINDIVNILFVICHLRNKNGRSTFFGSKIKKKVDRVIN